MKVEDISSPVNIEQSQAIIELGQLIDSEIMQWSYDGQAVSVWGKPFSEMLEYKGIPPHLHCAEGSFIMASLLSAQGLPVSFLFTRNIKSFHVFLETSFNGHIFFIDNYFGRFHLSQNIPQGLEGNIIKRVPFSGQEKLTDVLGVSGKIIWYVHGLLKNPYLKPNRTKYYDRKAKVFNTQFKKGVLLHES